MVHRPARFVPRPDSVRCINGSFAWLDHRLLREGHLERLTLEDLGVYVFLALAADKQGVSWYNHEKICRFLGLSWEEFCEARDRLIERDLIAFELFNRGGVDGYYQVLPLPEKPHA
jgi:hypothetical protein